MFDAELRKNRLIPVVVIEEKGLANALADAVAAGGLKCVEIALRTEAALEAIKIMANRHDMIIGAGTVLHVDQAKAAVDKGARFIVSPGMSMRIVNWCLENQVAVLPGCATPTEIQSALEAGLSTVKFFPAEALGGTRMLATLASVFQTVQFMPTGGINLDNILEYLALEQVVACGGSWMVKPEWIRKQRFTRIRDEIHKIVRLLATEK